MHSASCYCDAMHYDILLSFRSPSIYLIILFGFLLYHIQSPYICQCKKTTFLLRMALISSASFVFIPAHLFIRHIIYNLCNLNQNAIDNVNSKKTVSLIRKYDIADAQKGVYAIQAYIPVKEHLL